MTVLFKHLHKAAVLLFCASTTACGFFSPYTVSFRDIETESLQGETVNKTATVSVCYNPLYYSIEDADKIAETECEMIDAKAKFTGEESMSCSLLSPTTANYVCIDKDSEKPVIFTADYRKERLMQGTKPAF